VSPPPTRPSPDAAPLAFISRVLYTIRSMRRKKAPLLLEHPLGKTPEVFSGVPVLAPEEALPEEVIIPEVVSEPDESIFEDLDSPTEDDIILPVAQELEVPPMDEGLTEDDKKVFIDLIKQFSTPEARAKQLAKLATFSDTKRAAVALRAIQEINAITGVTGDKATEAAPMFALPKDSKVNIQITKVVK